MLLLLWLDQIDGAAPPVGNWILLTGFWDDTGEWDDTAVWID